MLTRYNCRLFYVVCLHAENDKIRWFIFKCEGTIENLFLIPSDATGTTVQIEICVSSTYE